MTDLVDPKLIEQISQARLRVQDVDRVLDTHEPRVVRVRVPHPSHEHHDLRECRLSKALDRGTHAPWWTGLEDRPVPVVVWAGLLAPATVPEAHHA